jgi:hypothetical protein
VDPSIWAMAGIERARARLGWTRRIGRIGQRGRMGLIGALDPERCSGLVYVYPRAMLWAGIGRSYRTRVVWGGCVTQSGGLGWYAVSRWDTGRGARGEGRGARGRELERCWARGLGRGKRQRASGVRGLRLAGSQGGGCTGFGVILLGAGRAASGSRRALVVFGEGLDMAAVGLRNSMRNGQIRLSEVIVVRWMRPRGFQKESGWVVLLRLLNQRRRGHVSC